MKKIKWIVLALVLTLGLIGGAYAAWSETLTIEGTVETGELKHRWYVHNIWGEAWAPNPWIEVLNGSPNSYMLEGETAIQIAIHNLYPANPGSATGGETRFAAWMYNTGTIPSRIQEIKITQTGGNAELWPYLQGRMAIEHWGPGAIEQYGKQYGVINMQQWRSLSALETYLNDHNRIGDNGYILPAGDYFRLCDTNYEGDSDDSSSIWFRLDPNTPVDLQGESVEFTIEFVFEQGV